VSDSVKCGKYGLCGGNDGGAEVTQRKDEKDERDLASAYVLCPLTVCVPNFREGEE
jgi:hypothetical protein